MVYGKKYVIVTKQDPMGPYPISSALVPLWST